MKQFLRWCSAFAVLVWPLQAPARSGSEGGQRPYRISDSFAVEEFRSVSYSPDGGAVAFVRRRAANGQRTSGVQSPHVRDDIWIVAGAGEAARNLTDGRADSSGWWLPRWSPDGATLTMLSSRGGDVTLWAWDRATGALRQVSPIGIDFDYEGDGGECRWRGARQMLCVTLPDGGPIEPLGSGSYATGRYIAQANEAWAAAAEGRASASVADSLNYPMPQRNLVSIDIATGEAGVVAQIQAAPPGPGGEDSFWSSTQAGVIAYIRPDFVSAFPSVIRRRLGYPADLALRRLDGSPVALDGPLPRNVLTTTLRWSPDGMALSFFALEDRAIHPELIYGEASRAVRYPAVSSRYYPGRLFRVDLRTGHIEAAPTGDIDLGDGVDPPEHLWLPSGDLAFNAGRLGSRAAPGESRPPEWTVLRADGQTRPLTSQPIGPLMLVEGGGADNGRSVIAVGQGDVWRLDPETGFAVNLTGTLAEEVIGVMPADRGGGSPFAVLVAGEPRTAADRNQMARLQAGGAIAGRRLTFARFYLTDLRNGTTTLLSPPDPQAGLLALAPDGSNAIFGGVTRDGSFLWRAPRGGPVQEIASANRFWRTVRPPQERIIRYHGLNGEPLLAKIYLPADYRTGRRYPIVVDSELDTRPGPANPHFELSDPRAAFFSRPDPSDAGAFTSAGYIYLWASMPTRIGMDDIGRNNLLSYTQGLLPALEAAVAQGYADPNRAFLYGTSSMAFGVYGVVTQTSRFTAAAAGFGWADNSAKQLSFDMRRRYAEAPEAYGVFDAQYLDGQFRTWRDGDMLRRNSPLTYVDRVQTPLLMLDSDFDAGWMENSEMFFSALVQQRKPARLVRYAGENHMLTSPANILDFYQRVFSWFDQWGDIARDASGRMIFAGDRVRARDGTPALQPDDYRRFDVFGPGGQ